MRSHKPVGKTTGLIAVALIWAVFSMGGHKPVGKTTGLIAVALIWAVFMTALTIAGLGSTAVLAVLAVPFVLVLPGYTFMAAAFPRRSFTATDTVLFSVCMSLVIVILGGLLLNLTPYGLGARSWSVFLGSSTICASIVTHLRWRTLKSTKEGRQFTSITPRSWLLFGLAAAIAAGSLALSSISAKRQEAASGYTELWIRPSGNSTQKQTVHLGIDSMQSATTSYILDVSVNRKEAHQWQTITLEPYQRWNVTLSLPPSGDAGRTRVDAVLYRTTAPSAAYRHVVLWLGP